MVQKHLLQTLKRVSIFEKDFNEKRMKELVSGQPPWRSLVEVSRIVDPKIGAAFAPRSLHLEHLSLSYLVNAEDFFGACLPTWIWPRLQSLTLTSQLLRHPGRRPEVDTLLYEAGVTALQMPKLQTLVVWDGVEGNACAFIYHVDRDHASVTWRGTWDMALSPRVVEVWQRVAFGRHPCALRVEKEQVDGVIESHGDAISRLGLPCQVVAPASLWQIRREAM
jgi:hypothetical protein